MNEQVITLVGAGGLGAPAAWSIVLDAPADHALSVRIIDGDTIDLSNLPRQILFAGDAVGSQKAPELVRGLTELHPDLSSRIRFDVRTVHLDPSNIDELIEGSTVILDCTDSVPTKLLLNDYAVQTGTTFCYGAAIQREAQLLLRPGGGSAAACLRCLFGDLGVDEIHALTARCHDAGILGPIVGAAGALMGSLAVRTACGSLAADSSMFSRFALDASSNRVELRARQIEPATDCPLGCAFPERTTLDLRGERCPMNFLYTKLAVSKLQPDTALQVLLGDDDSAERVYLSAIDEGLNPLGPPRLVAKDRHLLVFRSRSGTEERRRVNL